MSTNKSDYDEYDKAQLNEDIDTMNRLVPDQWYRILRFIESQATQRKVLDTTPDNIAARWAFNYSQFRKLLLRLRQINMSEN